MTLSLAMPMVIAAMVTPMVIAMVMLMVTPMIMPMVMSMANTHDYYQTLQTVTLQKSDINEAHLIYISVI
jgi:hypothetical protein